jgi:hypothetical protein
MTEISLVFAVLVLLFLLSKSLRNQFKFLVVPLLIFSGACLVYYIITGKPPGQIVSDINGYFSKPQLQDERSHKYYQAPDTRYGNPEK